MGKGGWGGMRKGPDNDLHLARQRYVEVRVCVCVCVCVYVCVCVLLVMVTHHVLHQFVSNICCLVVVAHLRQILSQIRTMFDLPQI